MTRPAGPRARRPRRRFRALVSAGAVAWAGCAGDGGSAPPTLEPARLEVEMLGGFRRATLPPPPQRIAVLIDATQPMARPAAPGASALTAARAGATRLVRTLPPDARVDAWALGATPVAGCASPPQRLLAEAPGALLGRFEALRPGGVGSLSGALERIAEGDPGGPYHRAVVFTTLESVCDEHLCEAARRLAEQGVRLDLVLLGAAAPPACLAEVTRVETGEPVLAETLRAVPFCVQTTGPDAAVHVCSETGGLPVVLPDERVVVDVQLDPPLRIERRFAPGTRWRLQVLDFPAADPPERQWRWQSVPEDALGRRARAEAEAP